MQSAAKHLARGSKSIVKTDYCLEQDASSLLDAQNALHDGLFGWVLITICRILSPVLPWSCCPGRAGSLVEFLL